MMAKKYKRIYFLFVIHFWFLFFGLISGCIRLSAGATYSHQGANDEAPTVKQVGFDTQNIVHPNAPGNIEMGDS